MVHSDSLANHRDQYDGDRFGINPTMTFAVNSETEIGLSFEYLDHERYIDRGIPTSIIGGVSTSASRPGD